MVESLFRRAKQFIGIEEEAGEENYGQQLEMSSILKAKKEKERENRPDVLLEIISYEPKVYEDSLNISGHLRAGCPVIINLKHLDPAEGTRLIDFVCGTAYAIDGHMMKIGETIFLFTPNSIAITSADDKASFGEELVIERDKRDSFFSR
ncbi:MAG: cell division protein SepF [Candidatus Margulisbacteria bacterium]|nr:cell division protein SepF [Candidatus Margulisiibacteriota bacterium]